MDEESTLNGVPSRSTQTNPTGFIQYLWLPRDRWIIGDQDEGNEAGCGSRYEPGRRHCRFGGTRSSQLSYCRFESMTAMRRTIKHCAHALRLKPTHHIPWTHRYPRQIFRFRSPFSAGRRDRIRSRRRSNPIITGFNSGEFEFFSRRWRPIVTSRTVCPASTGHWCKTKPSISCLGEGLIDVILL